MKKLSKLTILVAAVCVAACGVASAAEESDCKRGEADLGAVRADFSFGGMGYQRFGDLFIWKDSSRGKCEKGKKSDDQELAELFKKHDEWADDLAETESVQYRYCKLNVADNVTTDVRRVLAREDISYHPSAIVFVSRLDGDASFFLECFAGRREGFMNVDPSEL